MKTENALAVLSALLLLSGCSNSSNGNGGNNKPKISVNYSAMIKNSSSTSATPSASVERSAEVLPENSNSMDYSSFVEDIADKVAEKLSGENSQSSPEVYDSQSVSSITSSSEEYTGVSKPSQSQSAAASSPQEEIKADNSRAIKELQKQISICEMQIKSNNIEIENLEDTIKKYKRKQDSICDNELAKANVDLFNAEKKTVWVYSEGRGFQQVKNEKAVKEAQQQVDYYEEMISDYADEITRAERSIEKYKLDNEGLKEQIEDCQSEIAELS